MNTIRNWLQIQDGDLDHIVIEFMRGIIAYLVIPASIVSIVYGILNYTGTAA